MSRTIRTVAIMTPGDMGHAIGALLRRNGLRVITCLEGRSERTHALAEQAGIEGVAGDRALVAEADLVLSVLVPASALDLARRLAGAIREHRAELVYVDCNAIAPETTKQVGEVIEAAGACFVDGGIVGPPPRRNSADTRLYVSGPRAAEIEQLRAFGLDVRGIGERIGDASGLKMCYAALNKGTIALITELAIAAERLGVGAALERELEESQGPMLERMRRQVPAMVPKAHRWDGEMLEIARTFEACGLTPLIFQGVAEIYRTVANTPLGRVSVEDWARAQRSLQEVIAALAATSRAIRGRAGSWAPRG